MQNSLSAIVQIRVSPETLPELPNPIIAAPGAFIFLVPPETTPMADHDDTLLEISSITTGVASFGVVISRVLMVRSRARDRRTGPRTRDSTIRRFALTGTRARKVIPPGRRGRSCVTQTRKGTSQVVPDTRRSTFSSSLKQDRERLPRPDVNVSGFNGGLGPAKDGVDGVS